MSRSAWRSRSASCSAVTSSKGVASSASTVQRSGVTSAKPPTTMKRCSTLLPWMTSSTPGRTVEISGAWPCRTPKSPSLPGTTTMSASVARTSRSGMTSRKETLAIWLGRLGRELLGLGDGLVDRADHVEGGFGQVVVVARDDALEGLDGVLELHEHARRAGEDLGDVERLAEEALDLARAGHDQLVLFRERVHAQDGDDVLQRLVLLQHALDGQRHLVVLVTDDARVEHARGRVERVDGRKDRHLGDRAAEHRGRVQVGERRGRRRIGQVV